MYTTLYPFISSMYLVQASIDDFMPWLKNLVLAYSCENECILDLPLILVTLAQYPSRKQFCTCGC